MTASDVPPRPSQEPVQHGLPEAASTQAIASLNPEQAAAVQAPFGEILVLAGPGSGKTRVLTERVAHLVASGVPPWRIMAVTFTNKAAREMRERLEHRLGPDAASELLLGTFHAICARILRREAARVGIPANFVIYDTSDQVRVIKRALEDLNLDPDRNEARAIHAEISRAKNELIEPRAYVATSYAQEIARRVYERYEQLLGVAGALDFDDLLLEAALLFKRDAEVRGRYRERYRHILVDEFQDTNLAQYELVRAISGPCESGAPGSLFVVGDEDQSIYSWRGADFRNVLRFRTDYPAAHTFLLERNYRSTQNILDAASAVISRNRERTAKKLWTQAGTGGRVVVFEAHSDTEEASFVLSEIRRLVREGKHLADIAIMYRTNAQSRAVEDALIRYAVPYTLVGATRFYDRREVRDVLAYLRVIHNVSDDVALERIVNVPPRGIGPKAMEALRAAAADGSLWSGLTRLASGELPPDVPPPDARAAKALLAFHDLLAGLQASSTIAGVPDLITLVLVQSGYADWIRDGSSEGDERWENVLELRRVADDFASLPPEQGLPAMLESVALVADVDELKGARERLTLLTFHSAKGLEYETVFIMGAEEGLLPHSRSLEDPAALEEERRLFYVGITRARDRLVISRAARRLMHGSVEHREPSRFLAELPEGVVQHAGAAAGGKARPAQPSSTRWDARRTAAVARSEPPPRTRVLPRGGGGEGSGGDVDETPNEFGFRAGDKVRHGTFGSGVVVSAHSKDGDEEVTVAFAGAGVKKLLASFARLERV